MHALYMHIYLDQWRMETLHVTEFAAIVFILTLPNFAFT